MTNHGSFNINKTSELRASCLACPVAKYIRRKTEPRTLTGAAVDTRTCKPTGFQNITSRFEAIRKSRYTRATAQSMLPDDTNVLKARYLLYIVSLNIPRYFGYNRLSIYICWNFPLLRDFVQLYIIQAYNLEVYVGIYTTNGNSQALKAAHYLNTQCVACRPSSELGNFSTASSYGVSRNLVWCRWEGYSMLVCSMKWKST